MQSTRLRSEARSTRRVARRCAPAIAALAGVIVLFSPRPSRAQGIVHGLYLPVGMNIGLAFHDAGESPVHFVIGSEISLVQFGQSGEDTSWLGGYVDGLWDSGIEGFRGSIGPELGWGPFGLDFGFVLQANSDDTNPGFVVRPVFTASFIAIQGRYGHLFGGAKNTNYGELGLLIKIPFSLETDSPFDYL